MMRERRSEWNSFELPKGTNSPIGPFYRRLVPPLWIPAPSPALPGRVDLVAATPSKTTDKTIGGIVRMSKLTAR